MLRPERMSRVSVTGSTQVMDDVIETIHEMRLLHLTDYDGTWEGFDPGDPIHGADEASEKLVTVRSLQSILDVDEDTDAPDRVVTTEALETELESIRQSVNELDDQRSELTDQLRSVEDRIETMEPFATLGIDLDLLSGYDSLSVAVGDGDPTAIETALTEADIPEYELFEENGVVAVFARVEDKTPQDSTSSTQSSTLEDVLVGTSFSTHEIPDADGNPEEYIEELHHERQQLESELGTIEEQLDALRSEHSGFLLAAEETLTIDVQRQEAPLSFATTDNAFVSEGWIPTERFGEFVETLHSAVGDHVEIDELERASYNGDGHLIDREDVGGTPDRADPATTVEGSEKVAPDGGSIEQSMSKSEPPVVQDNPGPVASFEALVDAYARPKYSEFDPSIIVFLTFPTLFGFMIGDLGYGLLYAAIGLAIVSKSDGVVADLGKIALWAGGFTALFGVLYGEFFGLHQLGDIVWGGHPPLHKGLIPAYGEFANLWLVLSLLIGMVHMTFGYVFDFYEHLSHGASDAIRESGSWLLMLFGLWIWIFAGTPPANVVPGFLVGSGSVFNGNPIGLEFTGLPETVGLIGLGAFIVGVALTATTGIAEFIEAVFLKVLSDVLSYTRITAVLLAKAGMAFAVNLLVFGAYEHHGEYHFLFFSEKAPGEVPAEEMIFAGLVNGSGVELLLGAVGGVLIFVAGHLLVLALGVTSAGLQSIRLEWVEFFQKFYEGGGEEYSPFGRVRRFTSEE
ncbi:V-type ATP synthase subunit I [Halocatena pleomorpha]|uniref:A-type ATP synthase subunit I n=1 Tax=Halocatena pleomorpha TaxID=1785090 RepID=A0A3P3RCU6_9EURY|nr:V-type ATP synthase subunit I [Halocatena pleomorpha]RRJ30768.1 V-type ATP synthase subunit I [Halocatena pleomorpha]